MNIVTQNFVGSGTVKYIVANAGVQYIDIASGIRYIQVKIPYGNQWKVFQTGQVFIPSAGGATNLGVANIGASTLDITSSTGTSAVVPAATAGAAGLLTTALYALFNGKQAAGNYIIALTGDVTATGPGSVLATIANNAITTVKINTGAVTYDKIQAASGASKILGSPSTGVGIQELTIGDNLAIVGDQLSAIILKAYTEADAITAITTGALPPGAIIRIAMPSGDIINVLAIDSVELGQSMDYYLAADGSKLLIQGAFDGTGFTPKQGDQTAERDSTPQYDTGTNTLDITGYELIGNHTIDVAGGDKLDTITGGFEGCIITLYFAGGIGNFMRVQAVGNIVLNQQVYPSPHDVNDNEQAFITLRYRAGTWFEINYLLI